MVHASEYERQHNEITGNGSVSDLRVYHALRLILHPARALRSGKLPVEESQKSGHKKESYQRDSEGNGKSITKALDSGYFLAIAAQHGANEGHSQARNDGTKQ
jgi:hypothetical protein